MTATPEEVEIGALSSLLMVEGKVHLASDMGVDKDSFQIEDHALAWDYILERANAGKVVSVADVMLATDVQLIEGVTDDETFIPVLVEASQYRKSLVLVRGYITETDADLRAIGAIGGSLSELIGSLNDITTHVGANQSSFDTDIDARLEALIAGSQSLIAGKATGIPTGIPAFDDIGNLMQPGELIAIQGATNVGKSWFLDWICTNGYRAGYNVLYLTPESSVRDIELRTDVILAHAYGFDLSNRKLRNFTEDIEEYTRYVEYVKSLGRENGWITRDSGEMGSLTIQDIISLTREHRPDILAIDGFHLIAGKGSSWESMKEAATAIKGLTQSMGIVTLASSQAQRSASIAIDSAPTTGEAAYGMALNEAANRVISLAKATAQGTNRIFTVPKFRDGEVIFKPQPLLFDVDKGRIGPLNMFVNDDTGIVSAGDLGSDRDW